MTEISFHVDLDCLRGLYGSNNSAKAILDHLASRERNWSSTSVDRIQENVRLHGFDLSRGDVIEVFRALEACGCGEFKAGRRGWPSRFEWSVQMVDVGRAAAGEIEEVSDVAVEDVGDEPVNDLIKHTYRLRRDLSVTFELPTDLSQAEASRLANFIKTLPFDEEVA